MKPKYEVVFLKNAVDFLENLNPKARVKIYYNIDKARYRNDPELLKKLEDEIWEFRTAYQGIRYRLFAFWDKSSTTKTLVVATHGIIKKSKRIPPDELDRAKRIKSEYYNHKDN